MTAKSRWFFLFTLVSGTFAQEQPRFKANAQLVMIDVQVTEKGTGRVVELLGPKDFEIYDEDQRRDIREFHFETAPIDFVFLFYGKTGWGPLKDIRAYREGVAAAFSELRPGDRIALLRTDSSAKIDLPMTDFEQAKPALSGGVGGLQSRHRQGADRLYDAVKLATTLFPRPRVAARRRVIVAVTDDIERGSKVTQNSLITDLLESDATLDEVVCVWGKQPSHEVGVGGVYGIPRASRRVAGEPRTGASLRDAVLATGGEAISGDRIQEEFPELMRRIRMRYLLGFYAEPAAQRTFHRLDVRLTPEALKQNPNALVRARRGYYSVPADGNGK